VLDEVGVLASVAYGLRKLRAGYNGPIVRVRRNADNVERDFFAIGEGISISELLAFAKGDSCYIPTWYDQGGNGLDAAQTTAANQPRIVNAGVVDVDASGKPTVYFDGNNDVLSISDNAVLNITTPNLSINTVLKPSIAQDGYIFQRNADTSTTQQYGLVYTAASSGGMSFRLENVAVQATANGIIPTGEIKI
jgi:hypothetical protein